MKIEFQLDDERFDDLINCYSEITEQSDSISRQALSVLLTGIAHNKANVSLEIMLDEFTQEVKAKQEEQSNRLNRAEEITNKAKVSESV